MTPSERLRALHRHCSCWGESCRRHGLDLNSHCYTCVVNWPCDTVQALAELKAADNLADAVDDVSVLLSTLRNLIQDPRVVNLTEALRAYRGTE